MPTCGVCIYVYTRNENVIYGICALCSFRSKVECCISYRTVKTLGIWDGTGTPLVGCIYGIYVIDVDILVVRRRNNNRNYCGNSQLVR